MLLIRKWMGPQRLLAGLLLVALGAGRVVAAEPEGKLLRLGYFTNLTHAQALYARATGAFDKLGARIQWVAFNAGPTAIEAIFTDAVDATFVGPSPTINGYIKSKGDKFVVVAGSASGGGRPGARGGFGEQHSQGFRRQSHCHAPAWQHAGHRRAGLAVGTGLSSAGAGRQCGPRGSVQCRPAYHVQEEGDRRRLDGRALAGPAGSGGRWHRVPGGEIALARGQILDDAPGREQGISGR